MLEDKNLIANFEFKHGETTHNFHFSWIHIRKICKVF